MGKGEAILAIVVTAILGLSSLLIWYESMSRWRELKTPQAPRDPARYFRRRMFAWESAPVEAARWKSTSSKVTADDADGVEVEVAQILAVLDGTSSDDVNDIHTRLRLRLPDGHETVVNTFVNDTMNVRPGMFVPARPFRAGLSHVSGDTVEPVENLSPRTPAAFCSITVVGWGFWTTPAMRS